MVGIGDALDNAEVSVDDALFASTDIVPMQEGSGVIQVLCGTNPT